MIGAEEYGKRKARCGDCGNSQSKKMGRARLDLWMERMDGWKSGKVVENTKCQDEVVW